MKSKVESKVDVEFGFGVAPTLLTDLSEPSGANAEWIKGKIKYRKTKN